MSNFIRVYYEPKAERYLREDNGDEVTFTKQLVLLYQNEELVTKLSYTRAVDSIPTSRPVPCARIDGEKHMLDAEDIEVAEACLVAAGRIAA